GGGGLVRLELDRLRDRARGLVRPALLQVELGERDARLGRLRVLLDERLEDRLGLVVSAAPDQHARERERLLRELVFLLLLVLRERGQRDEDERGRERAPHESTGRLRPPSPA